MMRSVTQPATRANHLGIYEALLSSSHPGFAAIFPSRGTFIDAQR
jgi:hypothetical protein